MGSLKWINSVLSNIFYNHKQLKQVSTWLNNQNHEKSDEILKDIEFAEKKLQQVAWKKGPNP